MTDDEDLECPACAGSGGHPDSMCFQCGGRGYLLEPPDAADRAYDEWRDRQMEKGK